MHSLRTWSLLKINLVLTKTQLDTVHHIQKSLFVRRWDWVYWWRSWYLSEKRWYVCVLSSNLHNLLLHFLFPTTGQNIVKSIFFETSHRLQTILLRKRTVWWLHHTLFKTLIPFKAIISRINRMLFGYFAIKRVSQQSNFIVHRKL